jgi:Sigma-54 interaction domain
MPTDSQILRRQQHRPSFRTVPSSDWRELLRTRVNVLVTGPAIALTAFREMALQELREPVKFCRASLPCFEEQVATLILDEIDALGEADQRRLLRWIAERENAGTQIISLTSAPLYSAVVAGRFGADLYYRLNIVTLEIQAA